MREFIASLPYDVLENTSIGEFRVIIPFKIENSKFLKTYSTEIYEDGLSLAKCVFLGSYDPECKLREISDILKMGK